MGFPGAQWRESAYQCRRHELGFDPCVRKIPLGEGCKPSAVFSLREFHGLRNVAGYRPWGRKELNATEHTSIAAKCSGTSLGNALGRQRGKDLPELQAEGGNSRSPHPHPALQPRGDGVCTSPEPASLFSDSLGM